MAEQMTNGEPAGTLQQPSSPNSTPLQEFIRTFVETRRTAKNHWSTTKDHTRLLLEAARQKQLATQKLGASKPKSFTVGLTGRPTEGIYGPITSLVSHQAYRATATGESIRRHLALSNVPHLLGRTFQATQLSSAVAYTKSLQLPVTLKQALPHTHPNQYPAPISSIDDFCANWNLVHSSQDKRSSFNPNIEVVQSPPWIPIRVFVVGEKCVAAIARLPLYIVGNGRETIEQQANAALTERASVKFLPPPPHQSVDELLINMGISPNAVLSRDIVQPLTHEIGQLNGGWGMDVFEDISSAIKELAIKAVWSFPGLAASTVDILTPSLEDEETALVSDVVPEMDVKEFRYPAFGNSRFPHREIMSHIATISRRHPSARSGII